jgi:hypothetical protein
MAYCLAANTPYRFINIQQGLQPAKPVYQIAGNTLFDEQA